jgi:hypothetical protein
MKFPTMRSALRIKNRIKSCEKVYSSVRLGFYRVAHSAANVDPESHDDFAARLLRPDSSGYPAD